LFLISPHPPACAEASAGRLTPLLQERGAVNLKYFFPLRNSEDFALPLLLGEGDGG